MSTNPGYTDAQYAEPYTPTVEDIWDAVLTGALSMNQPFDETELRAMYDRFIESVGDARIEALRQGTQEWRDNA